MSMKIIETDDAPAAIAPYSQAVLAGPFVFVSGQIGTDPATGKLAGTFEDQARISLANLGRVLKAAELGYEDVASVDVFLTDMSEYQTFNAVYREYFTARKPARLLVQVGGIACGAQVEVRCVALAKSREPIRD